MILNKTKKCCKIFYTLAMPLLLLSPLANGHAGDRLLAKGAVGLGVTSTAQSGVNATTGLETNLDYKFTDIESAGLFSAVGASAGYNSISNSNLPSHAQSSSASLSGNLLLGYDLAKSKPGVDLYVGAAGSGFENWGFMSANKSNSAFVVGPETGLRYLSQDSNTLITISPSVGLGAIGQATLDRNGSELSTATDGLVLGGRVRVIMKDVANIFAEAFVAPNTSSPNELYAQGAFINVLGEIELDKDWSLGAYAKMVFNQNDFGTKQGGLTIPSGSLIQQSTINAGIRIQRAL